MFGPQSHGLPGDHGDVGGDRGHVEDAQQAGSGGSAAAHRRKVEHTPVT